MSAASPGVISLFFRDDHYGSHEEYLFALADAMRHEYEAIAGPASSCSSTAPTWRWAATSSSPTRPRRVPPDGAAAHRRRSTTRCANIPPERCACTSAGATTRGRTTTTCRSPTSSTSSSRPVRAAISFEAANPRHAHEWKVFEHVKLPADKVLIPGVIDSTTNFIEHPELVAQRIDRYARLVGREHVIAGTDCGFGTWVGQAAVDPDIAWAKLASLAEGARLASRELWARQ